MTGGHCLPENQVLGFLIVLWHQLFQKYFSHHVIWIVTDLPIASLTYENFVKFTINLILESQTEASERKILQVLSGSSFRQIYCWSRDLFWVLPFCGLSESKDTLVTILSTQNFCLRMYMYLLEGKKTKQDVFFRAVV